MIGCRRAHFDMSYHIYPHASFQNVPMDFKSLFPLPPPPRKKRKEKKRSSVSYEKTCEHQGF